jgi:hypothetical protein
VTWLTSMPLGVLVAGCIAAGMLLALAGRRIMLYSVPEAHHDGALSLSAAIMSSLGTAFAILAALTLSNAISHHASAESIVSREAGDASSLAWAATTRGVNTMAIHVPLAQYLQSTRANEWRGSHASNGDDRPTSQALARLENAVRTQATIPKLAGSSVSSELLSSLDGLTTGRRERLAAAATQLPGIYLLTLIITGAALVMNAGVLTLRASHHSLALIGGLAVVIGLSTALILGISTPWQGLVAVRGHSLDAVLVDLQSGYFHP